MNFHLTIDRPGHPTAAFDLPAGTYLIGRGEGCAIRLRSPDVSERHAILILGADEASLEDLQSSNGTQLDGVPLHGHARLAGEHVVGAGPYTLKLALPQPAPDRKSVV